MVEQLFTATGETKGSEKERREQLFTARRETEKKAIGCRLKAEGKMGKRIKG
jgi:hypothetical protein